MKNTIVHYAFCLGFLLQLSAEVYAQGQAKLMSVRAAEEAARRALAESLVGINMASQAEINDMVAGQFEVTADVQARIKEVRFIDSRFDEGKNIAMVKAEVDGTLVKNITGEMVDLGNRKFSRVGFGTSSPESAKALQSLRAAEIDAYRQLAEYFGGVNIVGKTKVKNYILESDSIKATFAAAIFGANLAEDDPYGFEDGTAYMRLTLTVGDVEDVMGQKLEYNEKTVTVKGWGAERDDTVISTGGQTMSVVKRSYAPAETKNASLDIPVNKAKAVQETRVEKPSVSYGGVQSR